jgi:hypothetical protein
VRVSHRFTTRSAPFDEDNLVSCAGLEGLGGATVNLESTLRIESTSGR